MDLGFSLPDDYKTFLLSANGGKIVLEHDIYVPKLSCVVFVNCLYPLSVGSPSLGIKERRDVQVRHRQGLRQGLVIGDDMGTGCFFLILDGMERGAIYFSFKDDLPMREADWYADKISIPDCMARISQTFSALGKAIASNKPKE